jgi:hypothetical protein
MGGCAVEELMRQTLYISSNVRLINKMLKIKLEAFDLLTCHGFHGLKFGLTIQNVK